MLEDVEKTVFGIISNLQIGQPMCDPNQSRVCCCCIKLSATFLNSDTATEAHNVFLFFFFFFCYVIYFEHVRRTGTVLFN